MSRNFENLKSHILPLSEARDFDTAKGEWQLIGVELQEDWDQCPCGKEIKELCHIQNRLNDHITYVGNVCIKQFIGIDTGNLFDRLKKIAADPTANPGTALIEHAYRFGYILHKDYRFLMGTLRKRRLSSRQLEWRVDANRRIIRQTVVVRNEDCVRR